MKIGLCDDDPKIRDMVRGWLNGHHSEIKSNNIYEFSCGEALLEHLRLNTLDMVFLDCRMNGMDGIDTAKAIRTNNTKLIIIILTDFKKYALFGYDVGAYNYILKDHFFQKIDGIYNNAIEHLRANQSVTFTVKTSDGIIQAEVAEIRYIESALRKKILALSSQHGNKSYDFYGNIESLETDLKEHGFIRPHKSFLVNYRFITKFNHDKLELLCGAVLPVSRTYYKTALEEFTLLSVR